MIPRATVSAHWPPLADCPLVDRTAQWVWLVSCLLVLPSVVLGQPAVDQVTPGPTTEFAIQTWRTDDGLPQNTVTALLQTRRGYLWAGTYNGIVQFDGLRFKVFDSSNAKGMANSRITCLYEDARGDVWIGHDTGEVSRSSDNGFTHMTMPANWKRAPIKDFVVDEKGELWVLNQPGAALHLAGGRIVEAPPVMNQDPFVNPRATVDTRRRAFVSRNGVIARFTSAGYAIMDFNESVTNPYYAGALAARDGSLWVIGQERLRKWDDTKWLADLGEFPWTDASVTTMLETSSGRLLVGTLQRGLFVYDPASGWSNLNRTRGLAHDWVGALIEDREKNIWVGTAGGLTLLRKRKVTMHSPPDEWHGRPVLSIARAHDGAVWAATEGAGVYRLQNGDWSHFNPANPFVWAVFEDSQQQIWAGTWGMGVFQLTNSEFVQQSHLIAPADPVTAFKESPAGTVWIGTGSGLARVRTNQVESFAHFGGAAAGDVRVIEAGINGELWFGTQGAGLGRWKNGQFTTYTVTNGLLGDHILSLRSEPDGALWIGTLSSGLCRFKNGVFRSITSAQGLPSDIIYHIADDELGNLWFNSTVGIFRVSKHELNACADGQVSTLQILAYGKSEGMTTLAGTGGFTPSGFRAPDGRLWFSTARGIAVVAPQSALPNPVRPHVWIEDVLVDGKSLPFISAPSAPAGGPINPNTARGRVVLNPGPRQLEVQFTGLSYTSPERVQFKYWLQGQDPDWRRPSTGRTVTYSFLPPGEYKFQVTACNSDGLWNEAGDSLAIVVLPHFWQTMSFRVALTVGSAGLIIFTVVVESRRRLRLKLERIARERELERERARIAQDIHDDLGASLTRIGMLSQSAAGDLNDPPRATKNLNQIYETARELTRAMDEIVWAVNPRHDTLESLANYIARFAHDFLSAAQIRCRLDAPLQMPELSVRSEVRHNLFLAFKETLNNAVKHSGATEVRVKLELPGNGLRLEVVDNGGGFVPRQSPAPNGARVVSGYGIAGVRRRLEQIGGRVEIRTAPGEGTRVELFVPFPAAFDRAKFV